MIEQLPIGWLFDQHVPLLYFLIALLTHPATWGERVLAALRPKTEIVSEKK